MRKRGRSAAASAESGAGDPVAGFLEHLSRNGHAIGTRDLIRAHELLLVAAAREGGPATLSKRLSMLRPLVCRSPEQQRDFAALLARWLATQGAAAEAGSPTALAKPVDERRQRRWVGFIAVAAFLILTEHRAHFLGYLPYIIFLACPLMHFFHHGHGHHGGTDASNVGSTVQRQEAAKERP